MESRKSSQRFRTGVMIEKRMVKPTSATGTAKGNSALLAGYAGFVIGRDLDGAGREPEQRQQCVDDRKSGPESTAKLNPSCSQTKPRTQAAEPAGTVDGG